MLRRLGLLLVLCVAPSAQESDVIRVGHWVEVRGELAEDGRFLASKVEIMEPEKYELLIGTVPSSETDADRFSLLGQPVHASERTDWEGIRPDELPGSRVKVEGRWRGPAKLSAREIQTRGPGRDRIGGRVDDVRATEGGHELRVMRFTVFVPRGAELEFEGSLEAISLADERVVSAFELPETELRAANDEDDLFGEGLRLTDKLALEGQLEARFTGEDNFDLDDDDAEDRDDLSLSARLRLLWDPNEDFAAVAEGRFRERWRDDEDDGSSSEGDFGLGEVFFLWRDAFGRSNLDLMVGRQDFDDPREWIYDSNLDGIRAFYGWSKYRFELSLSTVLADAGPRDKQASNAVAYLTHDDSDREWTLWSVYRDIDTDVEEQNLHLGARLIGEWIPDLDSWVDFAYLNGERGDLDISAWGYDIGGTWTPDFLGPASITVGYAVGRGDGDPDDGNDNTFRQTGLQDNNGRFDGVTSFRYYGELVDPELSNLGIFTLGLGFRIAEQTSLDFVWHHYLQDQARAQLFEAEIDDPDGVEPDLGWEFDVILGSRRWRNWDLEIVGAYFHPGDAYEDGDDAYLGKVQLRYRF